MSFRMNIIFLSSMFLGIIKVVTKMLLAYISKVPNWSIKKLFIFNNIKRWSDNYTDFVGKNQFQNLGILQITPMKFSSKSGQGTKWQIVIVYNQYIIISFLQFRVSKAFENKSSIFFFMERIKMHFIKSNGIIECIKTARQSSQETWKFFIFFSVILVFC
jgi:hypothetical protein